MRLRASPRKGYALMLVFLFLVLFLAFLGVAYRQCAAAVRIQAVRSQQAQRDQGSIPALARGLALLETGLPPTNPYVCGVIVTTPTGPTSFTVTYTLEGVNAWAVQAAPTQASENPEPMPPTFGPLTGPSS